MSSESPKCKSDSGPLHLGVGLWPAWRAKFADRTLQNHEHRASGLNLVIAAIALWNTLYMQRAVEHLRAHDVAAPDELLAHLSPMSWAHVGLTGDYLWADAAAAGGLRPLNDPTDRLYRAA